MFEVWRRAAQLPSWLKVLLLGRFVSSAGSMAGFFMTLYLVQERHLPPDRAGLIVAANGLATITGNLIGGSVGDRFGLRRTVIIAGLISSLSVAAIPLGPVSSILALVCTAGLIGGMSRPLMSALVAASLPADRRRESIALWRAASNAGILIGPPIGAALSAHIFWALFLIDGGSSLAMVAVVIARMPVDRRVVAGRSAPRGLWSAVATDRTLVTMLLTIVVVDSVYRLMYSVLPLHLAAAGQPNLLYGCLMAINGGLIVLGEAALASTLRRFPATTVIAVGFVLVGLGYALLIGPARGWPGALCAIAAMAVITAGEMLYKPTATAHAADSAPAGFEGRYQSLYGAASIMGMIVTPAVGGWAFVHVPAVVWPAALVLALAAAVALRRAPQPGGVVGGDSGGAPASQTMVR
jgi:predicted MFS family arabinose efflux permease